MSDPVIVCPQCQHPVPLTESLAAPLLAASRREFAAQLAQKDAQVLEQTRLLHQQAQQIADTQHNIEAQIAARLTAERARLLTEATQHAQQTAAAELAQRAADIAELQDLLRMREAKLAEAQQAQAEWMRKQRELDDARRELDLTVEQRVTAHLSEARAQARKDAEDSLRLHVAEKDQVIAAMQHKIEELRHKAEQGSQQLQGEVQELELENLLRSKFWQDNIEAVPKGEFGGDVLQRVIGPAAQVCGALLWESKRTKHWSESWLVKLRDDQRLAKADVAVLVSQALPKGVDNFDIIDNVWVVHPRAIVPVATVLRHSLIQISLARQASQGQQSKTELVYQYLTGPRFRQRVEAIVEAFSTMQDDLNKERKAIQRQWAKRQEQIERVMGATVGMYGDLQGIAGRSLQEIEGLSLQALGQDDAEAV